MVKNPQVKLSRTQLRNLCQEYLEQKEFARDCYDEVLRELLGMNKCTPRPPESVRRVCAERAEEILKQIGWDAIEEYRAELKQNKAIEDINEQLYRCGERMARLDNRANLAVGISVVLTIVWFAAVIYTTASNI